jgi:hypothetical protein
MAIVNIHIINEPVVSPAIRQAQELTQAVLVKEHYQGKHPYGSMRRDCPLCQSGK